jgi:hypothetical protein
MLFGVFGNSWLRASISLGHALLVIQDFLHGASLDDRKALQTLYRVHDAIHVIGQRLGSLAINQRGLQVTQNILAYGAIMHLLLLDSRLIGRQLLDKESFMHNRLG